jgi:hypothetical protein
VSGNAHLNDRSTRTDPTEKLPSVRKPASLSPAAGHSCVASIRRNIMHNLNKKGNFVHIKTQRERAAPWHRSFLFACPVKAQGWRMK